MLLAALFKFAFDELKAGSSSAGKVEDKHGLVRVLYGDTLSRFKWLFFTFMVRCILHGMATLKPHTFRLSDFPTLKEKGKGHKQTRSLICVCSIEHWFFRFFRFFRFFSILSQAVVIESLEQLKTLTKRFTHSMQDQTGDQNSTLFQQIQRWVVPVVRLEINNCCVCSVTNLKYMTVVVVCRLLLYSYLK